MSKIVDALNQYDAERIVESLRAGVPIPALAQKLPIGRSALLERVNTMLGTGYGSPLIVRANYGDGKTHFLQSVAGLALEAGYVVSMVSISREAPLNNLGQLFGAVTARTRTPGSKRLGLAPILDKLQGCGRKVARDLEEAGIPERLRASVEAYLHFDMTYRHELLADLSGQPLLVSRLKAILKDLGMNNRLANYAISRDPVWLYRVLAQLVQIAGFPGWLIVLDELELIGKTEVGTRARAYANFYNLAVEINLPRTVFVGAVASNYHSDVLEEKNDAIKAPEWLEVRGLKQQAAMAQKGIDQLQHAERLPELSKDEMHTLLATIRDAHGRAYAWEPPPLEELEGFLQHHVRGADAKLRTHIRTTVQWLDLWFQYQREPHVVVWHIGEVDLTEREFREEEDDAGIPVQRTRLF